MQGATQEDDTELRLKQLYAEREELLKPKPTIGGYAKEAFKGLVPGAIGLAETAGTGIASMLPDSTEKAAREKIKELAGIAKKPFEAAPGYEDSVVRKLSEGLGSTLPFLPLAPLVWLAVLPLVVWVLPLALVKRGSLLKPRALRTKNAVPLPCWVHLLVCLTCWHHNLAHSRKSWAKNLAQFSP
jgi:hypothetical protein